MKTINDIQTKCPETFKIYMEHLAPHPDVSCAIILPPKAGKKILIMLDSLVHPEYIHLMVTSLDRKDNKCQFKELAELGIKGFCFTRSSDRLSCMYELSQAMAAGKKVIIHCDESDYGTAKEQGLSIVWNQWNKNPSVKWKYYSATNEELTLSNIAKKMKVVKLPVPSAYFGADDYLENHLVNRSLPFLEYSGSALTDHGREVLSVFEQDCRPFAVVRIPAGTYFRMKSFVQNTETVFEMVRTLSKFNSVFVDGSSPFDWMNDWNPYFKEFQNTGKKTIFFICQTCTRSTEVGFHKYISVWHDHRDGESTYGTMYQAIGRVFHYPKSDSLKPMVYCVPEVMEYAAGLITENEYCSRTGSSLGGRIYKPTRKYRMPPNEGYGWKMMLVKGLVAGIATTFDFVAGILTGKKKKMMDSIDYGLEFIGASYKVNSKVKPVSIFGNSYFRKRKRK